MDIPLEKWQPWIVILIAALFFTAVFFLTPKFRQTNIYQPNPMLVDGGIIINLRCESNEMFITTNSNITCSVRSDYSTTNYARINLIIQAEPGDGNATWGCFPNQWNITNRQEYVSCENKFFSDTISRPPSRLLMRVYSLQAYRNKDDTSPEVTLSQIRYVDRPIEIMSHQDAIALTNDNYNLFLASWALIILVILEIRKTIIKNK